MSRFYFAVRNIKLTNTKICTLLIMLVPSIVDLLNFFFFSANQILIGSEVFKQIFK